MTIKTTIDYLAEMKKAKKQYEQYIETSQIYQLPIFQSMQEPQYAPPNIENPLTTDKVTMTK